MFSTHAASGAGDDPVAAAIDVLFDALADQEPGSASDERVAAALDLARPPLVHSLRRLETPRLISSVDSLLATYITLVDPRGTGTQAPSRSAATPTAQDLAYLARWNDLETTRAVAAAANVVAMIDLVLTGRRHRREAAGETLAGTPAALPTAEEVQAIIDRRAGDLLQLDHDLVGAEALRTDVVESSRAGKKLAAFDTDPAVAIIRQVMRRLVALGYDRIVDSRRGTGSIVSVP